jgi:hypothetical protein
LEVVRECCETLIVGMRGASTECLHHAVIPRLLETGLLTRFSRQTGDLTPLLQQVFEFDNAAASWHLPANYQPQSPLPRQDYLRYRLVRMLSRIERPASEAELDRQLRETMKDGELPTQEELRRALAEVAYSPRQPYWRLPSQGRQQELCFTERQA